MKRLEDLAKSLTFSAELEEQRKWHNNFSALFWKIRETLRDRKLRSAYLNGLDLMRQSFTRSIEMGRRRMRERELGKTHYKVNMHYHSGYPFSGDAMRMRDPYLGAVKHMRKYRVTVLYVTDHDNNLFFVTLRNDPPRSITKRFEMFSDEWMITLEKKKGLLRRHAPPLYIMNAREDHVLLKPGDRPLLNLEMIRPCKNTLPEKARILPIKEFLEQSYPFATINHPNLQDSFETEDNVDHTFDLAHQLNVPLFLEIFNGGVTPIQGFTNIWAGQYAEKHPQTPLFVGSDLHRPDVRPACMWIPKEMLDPALKTRNGLSVNFAMCAALQNHAKDGIVHDKIYSNPYKVLSGYVVKKLIG